MNNRILTILILFLTQTSFSQQLTVEAVYYDNNQVPYKIERKYSDNNLVTYVTHFIQGSFCVKRLTSFSGDTTIIKEASYGIFNKKTKLELFQDCETWSVSSNMIGDTIWLKGYKMEYSPDTMTFVGDTILTGESAKNSWDFSERIKKVRVPLILSGNMTINTDSLILNETVIAYFIKSIPVKVEVFDSKNKQYCTSTGTFSKDKLVWKRYFMDKGNIPFQIDTISWNQDTTEIVWHSNRLDDIKWNTITRYHISGTKLKFAFSDTLVKEIEYLDGKNIFRNMLIGDFIYNDVLYYIELRLFDREITVSIKTNSQTSNNKYTFDNQGKIIEQLSYDKGQLEKRVTYKYEN